ncbi:MAG: hypothetical protein WCF85_16745 [Rhodospirillaceae bacterium]
MDTITTVTGTTVTGTTVTDTARSDVPLCCPCDAKTRLYAVGDDRLVCHTCGRGFPVVGGVPVLIRDENSVFSVSDYSANGGYDGCGYPRGRCK